MALTNNKVQFAYFANKSDFTSALQTELTNNIVFVEDTKEVYTHGTFFGIRAVTLNYDSATARIQLKDGDAVISEVDATPFLKDGMIDNVELITTPEGSSAVLSVDGTNYPIVELDATDFDSSVDTGASDTDFTFKVIPTLDSNKAYIIKNANFTESVNDYSFSNQGTFIVQFQSTGSLSEWTSIAIGHNDPDGYNYYQTEGTEYNEWLSIPATYQFNVTDWGGYDNDTTIPYYGTSYEDGGSSTITELTNAAETTGSASNSNYPTLPYLKFTFNIVKESESGTLTPSHQVVRVSVADLVDAYDGANVYLSSNYAKAVSYADPAINDSVDTAVGKLTKGLNDAQAQLLWNEYAGA